MGDLNFRTSLVFWKCGRLQKNAGNSINSILRITISNIFCASSKTFQSYHSCQLPPNRQLITRKFDPSYSFSHLSNSSNMEHTPIRMSRFFYTHFKKCPICGRNSILTELYFSYLNFCAIFCQFVISRTFLRKKGLKKCGKFNFLALCDK